MKYRIQTFIFNEQENEVQTEGRVVAVIGAGEGTITLADDKEVTGSLITCLVEFPDSALSVAQFQVATR